MTVPTGSNMWRNCSWSVVLLLALAAALRFIGNRHGLPWIEEPDLDTVRLASKLAGGEVGWGCILRPTRYPLLLFYLFVPLLKLFPDTNMIWIGRIVSGLFGTGTVLFAYLCGTTAHSKRAGILAGFLTAFSFLAVQHAHLAKPHVPVAFFTTACMYFCMRIMKDPKARNYVLAGLTGGAALATLHSGFIVIAALLAAVILAPSSERRLSWRRYIAPRPMILLAFLAAFILIGHLNRIAALIKIMNSEATWSLLMAPHGGNAATSLGLAGFSRTALLFLLYDPWISILGTTAFIWGLWKRPKWWHICMPGFAMILLFLAVFGHVRMFAPRFFILVLPMLAVCSATFVAAVTDHLRPSLARPVFITIFLFCTLTSGAVACKLVFLSLREDTRELAVQWIQANVPTDQTLAAVPYQDFPLPLTKASIENHKKVLKHLPHFETMTLKAMSRGEEAPAGPGRYTVFFPFKDGWKAGKAKRREIIERSGATHAISVFFTRQNFNNPLNNVFSEMGEVVFRARPGGGGYFGGHLYFIPNPYLSIWYIERPGPLVEVVRF